MLKINYPAPWCGEIYYRCVSAWLGVIRQQYRLRRGSFEPALIDEKIITMEICGKYFKLECDKDIFEYFHTHYLHFFPKFTDRSLFTRQSANLLKIKSVIQKESTIISGYSSDHFQEINTFPLPVCVLTRAKRGHCFPAEADFGYCAAKNMHYYRFKLGFRISRLGMITSLPITASSSARYSKHRHLAGWILRNSSSRVDTVFLNTCSIFSYWRVTKFLLSLLHGRI